MAVTLEDQIACLKREIAIREGVYPKWIANGRMKQSAADLEIERMTAALHTLMNLEQLEKAVIGNDEETGVELLRRIFPLAAKIEADGE